MCKVVELCIISLPKTKLFKTILEVREEDEMLFYWFFSLLCTFKVACNLKITPNKRNINPEF